VTLAAGEGWSAQRDTKTLPTDAFGQIDFQGACHASKAQVISLFKTFKSINQSVCRSYRVL